MDTTDVRILSAHSALPGPPVDNAALARRFGMEPMWEQWVDAFVGTRTRHLAVNLDSGEVLSTLADLGEIAGRRALAAAGVTADEIDVMVLATATPDMLMPATVNMIAERLGIDGISTYQLQSGCSGAVAALDIGMRLLRTGGYRNALVLGGDVCAKHFDLGVDLRDLPPAQLVNVVLFGDGAGAAVLTTDPVPGTSVLRHVLNRLTGLNRAPGQIIEWFGAAELKPGRPALSEDYKAIEQSVPAMATEIGKELLDHLGWAETDVDYLLPPQLSGRMTARIVEQLGLPTAEEITCVEETGNTGNALPFLQLERTLPRMVTGDRAIGIAVESSKWIKAGFALERV
ncbi:3-oxoacyl-ACP synthase III family protein [Frankia sp. AgB1.9]|uniref:3-oxoacyl-ACP synthase III family protein n=1 Tax=unclassified Frankia TaxID=2632575 RepID=UPI001934A0BC|nr:MULTISPECIES: 3-oxoacyl-ACP synthase III family protein [unclassified Frankia]MBL7491579.1 3-oxoacyl-ACP synthase III family protein [Frankia sp. AgW1.1]MBL7553175.1 3-oxoacyl-ACP synthase III family protein [Frankia sp. AgB1.9]MBL7624594.1 3-oxoacyl-ACP synthase III family protein [Frankia sp. AgB1.8]